MKYFVPAILGIIAICGAVYVFMNKSATNKAPQMSPDVKVRYVPIGDSYTIGVGVPQEKAFPALLTRHLNEKGVDIALIENPAVSGYTVRDAMRYELPVLRRANANFITVLIGANDIMSKSSDEFASEYSQLLDGISKEAPGSRVLLILLPDFSYTPHMRSFGYSEEEIKSSITAYNVKIKDEALKRNLPVVDLFAATTGNGYNPELFIEDEFHPSEKQYEMWEKAIYPVAIEALQ